MSSVDCTTGEITSIASLEGNVLIGVDCWVDPPGANSPLRAVQMEREFHITTNKGVHTGRPKDYLVENHLQKRWIVPKVVFEALFLS